MEPIDGLQILGGHLWQRRRVCDPLHIRQHDHLRHCGHHRHECGVLRRGRWPSAAVRPHWRLPCQRSRRLPPRVHSVPCERQVEGGPLVPVGVRVHLLPEGNVHCRGTHVAVIPGRQGFADDRRIGRCIVLPTRRGLGGGRRKQRAARVARKRGLARPPLLHHPRPILRSRLRAAADTVPAGEAWVLVPDHAHEASCKRRADHGPSRLARDRLEGKEACEVVGTVLHLGCQRAVLLDVNVRPRRAESERSVARRPRAAALLDRRAVPRKRNILPLERRAVGRLGRPPWHTVAIAVAAHEPARPRVQVPTRALVLQMALAVDVDPPPQCRAVSVLAIGREHPITVSAEVGRVPCVHFGTERQLRERAA